MNKDGNKHIHPKTKDNLYHLNNNTSISITVAAIMQGEKVTIITIMVRCDPYHSTNSFHI
jgi:hypothetical protein